MAIISGILKDPAGRPIPNCTIELKALKHSLSVIQSTTAGIDVENSGYYSINVEPNDYQVKLYVDGLPSVCAGKICVQTDSADGTLNSFLSAPGEEDLTPEVMRLFQMLADQVNKAAEATTENAQQVSNDKNSVELLKQQVQKDYSNVQQLNSNVEQISSNLELTKQEVLAAQDSVQKDKILTKQYADQVLTDKKNVETLKDEVVNVNKVVEVLSEQSKHYANQAEVAAKSSKAEANRAESAASNATGSIQALKAELLLPTGASMIGYGDTNVNDAVTRAQNTADSKVWSVNGQRHFVDLTAGDVGAISVDDAPVYMIFYPNGTEESPYIINPNERLIFDSPFGIAPAICEAQVWASDMWGSPGWVYSTPHSQGVTVNQVNSHLVVQTGSDKVVPQSHLGGGVFSWLDAVSAPFRIRLWRITKW